MKWLKSLNLLGLIGMKFEYFVSFAVIWRFKLFMFSLLFFLTRKLGLTGSPCSVCVCPTFYFGKDDRFFPNLLWNVRYWRGFQPPLYNFLQLIKTIWWLRKLMRGSDTVSLSVSLWNVVWWYNIGKTKSLRRRSL